MNNPVRKKWLVNGIKISIQGVFCRRSVSSAGIRSGMASCRDRACLYPDFKHTTEYFGRHMGRTQGPHPT